MATAIFRGRAIARLLPRHTVITGWRAGAFVVAVDNC
jgi:hypothetical protein